MQRCLTTTLHPNLYNNTRMHMPVLYTNTETKNIIMTCSQQKFFDAARPYIEGRSTC